MPSSSSQTRALTTVAATTAFLLGLVGTLYYLDIPSFLRQRTKSRKVEPRCYSLNSPPSLLAFKTLLSQVTLPETYPLAEKIEKNIPVYKCASFDIDDTARIEQLQDEIHHILLSGPGVLVIKNFFSDLSPIDTANETYTSIIASELGSTSGDHFAPTGKNSRIWNSFSKHCLAAPSSFLSYYSNPWFQILSLAWLGPAYRITTQVNIVKPGGAPQTSHRDYHLGFQTTEEVAKWPREMHIASQFLTLQGAVAHSDMPLESGPTRFLPFSQMYEEGFMAYRRGEFEECFLEKWVSLPLQKGDAVFFNPALFHAAGRNDTEDVERSANLIQVSSAFGKPMESVDTLPLIERTWELLVKGELGEREVEAFICAVAEGYPFPTNLDRRPPAPGGMAPESEQQLLRRAFKERWGKEEVVEAIEKMREGAEA